MQGIDELGFLPGWGNTVGRVRESFQLLLDIIQARERLLGTDNGNWVGSRVAGPHVLLSSWRRPRRAHLGLGPPCLSLQAPDADTLEKFLARLPLMFKASGGVPRPCDTPPQGLLSSPAWPRAA